MATKETCKGGSGEKEAGARVAPGGPAECIDERDAKDTSDELGDGVKKGVLKGVSGRTL